MAETETETEVRKCFNRSCGGEVESARLRNGWRLSSGGYSSLCDRCASLFEEERFCEVFHSQASGWAPCESCNKRIHCGCIVSSQAFTLLDAGGIECITCAKTSGRLVLSVNRSYSPPPFGTPLSERIKDHSAESWSQFAIVGPRPRQRHEMPTLYNSHLALSEAHMRIPHDVGISNGCSIYDTGEVFPISTLEKRSRQEMDWPVSGIARTLGINEKRCSGLPQEMMSSKELSSNLTLEALLRNSSSNACNSEMEVSGYFLRTAHLSQSSNLCHSSEIDSSIETPIQKVRLQGDRKGKNQLLARYLPRATDEELQKIAGSSKIKPLFEKTLSASDAGRIGRLVVPKKCAEAYFPHISQPEGIPLKVQDVKGKDWLFQFRFWPNNNSRMYVLEGVSAYIQSMHLLAGDKVTFSRLEPEGKLVMGFRKSSNGSTDHNDEANTPCNNEDTNAGCIAKDIRNGKSSGYRKRKSSTFSFKDRYLLFENMNLFELKITLEEAQRLMRPSPNDMSHVVLVANEIEEYEDCPVIGKPTIFTTDKMGESIQWVQCKDCLKWRRLPADALLPVNWTCSNNIWDSERSTCTSPQDISAEQLDDLLLSTSQSVSKKVKTTKEDMGSVEALEGRDTLANLAIMGEGHVTTKHPRHRIGCTCIVCIQPPSGKAFKHKHTCECTFCLTVKRRFQTLMLTREKKQKENYAMAASEKHPENQLLIEKAQENEQLVGVGFNAAPTLKEVSGGESAYIFGGKNSSGSSLKVQIDLNIQPERDDSVISSELNALGSSSYIAEAENQMKSHTGSPAMEVAGDSTQTEDVIETIGVGADNPIVTNQEDGAPPADAQPEKESTATATSG